MKQSPSVIEINQVDGHQSDASVNREKGRSPNPGLRSINNPHTENSDDDYNSRQGVGLTRDSKHTRSNRKIKPMYGIGNN